MSVDIVTKTSPYWELMAALAGSSTPGQMLVGEQGIRFLELMPELSQLRGVPQDPVLHPEGDAFVHTMHTLDAMADICQRDGIVGDAREELLMAALCHDLGKATHTSVDESGKIISYCHEKEGVEPTLALLSRLQAPERMLERVPLLVKYHMVYLQGKTEHAVRKILKRIDPLQPEDLLPLFEADQSGRPPLPRGVNDEILAFFEVLHRLRTKVARPKRLVSGLTLLQLPEDKRGLLGIRSAGDLKPLLERCDAAQEAGLYESEEAGVAWLLANTK